MYSKRPHTIYTPLGATITINSGATSYCTIVGNNYASELQRVTGLFRCRVGHFMIKTEATSGSSGAITWIIRKNQVNTSCVIIVASNSAAGYYENTTNIADFWNGGMISVQCTNLSGATSPGHRVMVSTF